MVVNKGKYCVPLPAFFLTEGRKLTKRKEQEGMVLFIQNGMKQLFKFKITNKMGKKS